MELALVVLLSVALLLVGFGLGVWSERGRPLRHGTLGEYASFTVTDDDAAYRAAVREHERRLAAEEAGAELDMTAPWEEQPAWARGAWSAAGITQELFEQVLHGDGFALSHGWYRTPKAFIPNTNTW
jgi:hypothetical protein